MQNIKIVCIEVKAKPGSSLRNCVSECIVLAAKENKPVELTHQGNIYKVNPETIIEKVINTGGI